MSITWNVVYQACIIACHIGFRVHNTWKSFVTVLRELNSCSFYLGRLPDPGYGIQYNGASVSTGYWLVLSESRSMVKLNAVII